jgi:hypothetical protein
LAAEAARKVAEHAGLAAMREGRPAEYAELENPYRAILKVI